MRSTICQWEEAFLSNQLYTLQYSYMKAATIVLSPDSLSWERRRSVAVVNHP